MTIYQELLKMRKHPIRIIIFSILVIVAILLPQTGLSDGNKQKIILIETMPVQTVLTHSRWFVQHLENLGHTKENGVRLVTLQIKGDREYGAKLLQAELAKGRPALVATSATLASQMTHEMIEKKNIPQVFFTVSDPIGSGLVKAIGSPSRSHITGIVHMIKRETRINMVAGLIKPVTDKRPINIGFIHSTYPSSMGDIRELQQAAENRPDINFIPYQITYIKMPAGKKRMLTDVRAAIRTMKNKIDYWWEPSGPLGEINEYTSLLLEESSKPIVMGTKLGSVKLGALLHLTPHPEATGREAALMADAILKGSDPGSIPVTPPSAFDLGINITSAVDNQIVIPPDLLELAGDQIFK